MATWLVPRATTSERLGLGAIPDGDLIYDTNEEALFIGDDSTVGGHRVANNSTITIVAGDQMDLGDSETGVFTINQLVDQTITIDHGAQEDANAMISHSATSGNRTVFLSGAQVDSRGHVISLETDSVIAANDAIITFTGGTGLNTTNSDPDNTISLNQDNAQTIVFNHDDTSTLTGEQTTANQVINSITVDGLGHVTAIGTRSVASPDITSVNGSAIADNSITNAKLVDNTIEAGKIAPDAIGSSELANNAVDTAAIVDGNVTLAKLATNSVDATKIVDNSVGSAEIATNAVGANELANNAVDTAAIANDAVTAAKLGNITSAIVTIRAETGSTPSVANFNGAVFLAEY